VFITTVDTCRIQQIVGKRHHKLPDEKHSERIDDGKDQSRVRIHQTKIFHDDESWNHCHLLGYHQSSDVYREQQPLEREFFFRKGIRRQSADDAIQQA
jgi:hypothetical protein